MQVLHLKPGSHLRDFIECTRFDSFQPLSLIRGAREINPKRGTKSHNDKYNTKVFRLIGKV